MSTIERHHWFSAMSVAQRQAWFNLAIIGTTVVLVAVLVPVFGFQRAHGSLGILGLLGLSPFLFRKRAGAVHYDERDFVIQLRSWTIAYAIFWVAFVVVCVSAPLTYGSTGFVPVWYVQLSVWYGFMIVWGTCALATLIQYARGGNS